MRVFNAAVNLLGVYNESKVAVFPICKNEGEK
jgi:hypothetical protein